MIGFLMYAISYVMGCNISMPNKLELLENLSCKRFEIDGKEYLRVEGVWFLYTNDEYKVIDKPEFETYYKEKFENGN